MHLWASPEPGIYCCACPHASRTENTERCDRRPLYRLCCAAGLPTALLMAYAADGNNIPEALLLASASAPAVPAGLCPAPEKDEKWRIPPSWAPLLARA